MMNPKVDAPFLFNTDKVIVHICLSQSTLQQGPGLVRSVNCYTGYTVITVKSLAIIWGVMDHLDIPGHFRSLLVRWPKGHKSSNDLHVSRVPWGVISVWWILGKIYCFVEPRSPKYSREVQEVPCWWANMRLQTGQFPSISILGQLVKTMRGFFRVVTPGSSIVVARKSRGDWCWLHDQRVQQVPQVDPLFRPGRECSDYAGQNLAQKSAIHGDYWRWFRDQRRATRGKEVSVFLSESW